MVSEDMSQHLEYLMFYSDLKYRNVRTFKYGEKMHMYLSMLLNTGDEIYQFFIRFQNTDVMLNQG